MDETQQWDANEAQRLCNVVRAFLAGYRLAERMVDADNPHAPGTLEAFCWQQGELAAMDAFDATLRRNTGQLPE